MHDSFYLIWKHKYPLGKNYDEFFTDESLVVYKSNKEIVVTKTKIALYFRVSKVI